ncbi:DUF4296 domain-containing protein [Salinimicrobium sp. CDJ15-81-2]|nr:DUF4296 domain-containing protein [Salinimicrobium nanhaiense]
MKKLSWVIILVLILSSCQDVERMEKPENLIPRGKMVEVLTELSLLHGARSYNKNMLEEKGIAPYPYLMQKYGIDSAQLVQSNNYYAQNYREYGYIYEEVKQRLELLMKKYDSLREIEEKERDSLRNLNKDSLDLPVDTLQQDSLQRRLPAPISRKINSFNINDTVGRQENIR